MSTLLLDAFPDGKRKALVMSYDDGPVQDRRLVELFNRYGLRGTFHLNSGYLDQPGKLTSAEIKQLFNGHEVSVHTVTHPHLPHLPGERIIQEIMDDRRTLESLVGYTVRGMSYPGGGYDDRLVAMLPLLGIEYARTVNTQKAFDVPGDFLRWPASCHHGEALARAAEFKAIPPRWSTQVFYVWGHSYEFDHGGGWVTIETFCKAVAHDPAVWYTTHIGLVDYLNALRRARCSADGSILENPSAIPIWATVDEAIVRVNPGATLVMGEKRE